MRNRIQIFGTWMPAFQKGRGWDGVGSMTLRFVLDYTLQAQMKLDAHERNITEKAMNLFYALARLGGVVGDIVGVT